MAKKALITGVAGQDGAYLAEYLLSQDYEVAGLVKQVTNNKLWRLDCLGITDKVEIYQGDLTDTASLTRVITEVMPQEVYNLAAQSFVKASFDDQLLTANVTGLGPLRLLNVIKEIDPTIRFYQASSSEMFGKIQEPVQNEQTPFYPRSPYASAKLYAHWTTVNFRESYQMYTCSGILFNHESPLRGEQFVTRKVTQGAAKIKLGLQQKLRLGNLDACRDWGHAKDYVRAMHLMLNQKKPDDYVIATGKTTSVREMCKFAFEYLGLDYQDYVEVAPEFFRPAEVDVLLGDPAKAKQQLGWEAQISFEQMVAEMVDYDIALFNNKSSSIVT